MTDLISKNFIVTGRVQGVWFRSRTKDTAHEIGVTGWVKNLPDGTVEVQATGTKTQLTQLEAWLNIGPEKSNVTKVESKETPYKQHKKFKIT